MTAEMPPPVQSAPLRYSRVAATLHWVAAILIIGLLIQGFVMTKAEDGDQKTLFYQLHVTLGYVALILSIALYATSARKLTIAVCDEVGESGEEEVGVDALEEVGPTEVGESR